MRGWGAQQLAERAGAQVLAGEGPGGPGGVSIDSRALSAGDLFVGLAGERQDGGAHWSQAVAAGAWGVLVAPGHAAAAAAAHRDGGPAVLSHERPLQALHALARAWREELRGRGAKVLAITGSTGKTSTKDILAALLASRLRTVASPQNLNTEIGLPLALLAAGADTQALVLEMAMRGAGQIAELTEIADPDVGVIVNVGPAHLELLGSLEAIAAAKAELIAGLAPHATAVVPAGERLLEPHLRSEIRTVTFGAGGDVRLVAEDAGVLTIDACGERLVVEPSFDQAHNVSNLLAAVAAARAAGVTPAGRLDVEFSSMRGQRVEFGAGVTLVEDCYNANPMSMAAALEELARDAARGRVAVLGDMLELGPDGPELHRELGARARAAGVSLLVTVGPLAREIAGTFDGDTRSVEDAAAAAALVPSLLAGGETVLLKGSRGVGLERVADALKAAFPPPAPAAAHAGAGEHSLSAPGQR